MKSKRLFTVRRFSIRYRENGAVVIYDNHGHESDPVGYQGIARLGEYYATSDYYSGVLPSLFRVLECQVKPVEKRYAKRRA